MMELRFRTGGVQDGPNKAAIVIAGDAAIRHSLAMLLEAHGLGVRVYETAGALLNDRDTYTGGHLLVVYRAQCSDGIAMVRDLRVHGLEMPAIILAANVGPMCLLDAGVIGATAVEVPSGQRELDQAIRSIAG